MNWYFLLLMYVICLQPLWTCNICLWVSIYKFVTLYICWYSLSCNSIHFSLFTINYAHSTKKEFKKNVNSSFKTFLLYVSIEKRRVCRLIQLMFCFVIVEARGIVWDWSIYIYFYSLFLSKKTINRVFNILGNNE